MPFAEHEQPFPPDQTLSQKRSYDMQNGERSGSDEKPKYRPVSMSGHEDAHRNKRQHETENGQISISFA